MTDKEIIKNIGTINKTCLNSSYKLTLKNINNKIIDKIEIIREPISIEFSWFENNFFSVNGNITNPSKIKIGSFTSNQSGMYDEGKSCAFMHSPNVMVQTVWIWLLIYFMASIISIGLFQKLGWSRYKEIKNIKQNKIIFVKKGLKKSNNFFFEICWIKMMKIKYCKNINIPETRIDNKNAVKIDR